MVTTTARRPERCGAFSATASDRRTSARTLLASRAKRDRVPPPLSKRSTRGCRRRARVNRRCRRSKESRLRAVRTCVGASTRSAGSSSRGAPSSLPTAQSATSCLPAAICCAAAASMTRSTTTARCWALPAGLIDNVTDGTNAFLVALEQDRGVLVSEAEIVDAKQQNRISDVFLIDRPLSEDDRVALERLSKEQCATWLDARSRTMPLNPRLRARIAAADLIIYAPGTQHSSLFPSYLTKDLSRAIASNLKAMKLLVTNIQADAEISGSTAVDIVERAVYYLKEKGRLPLPGADPHHALHHQRPGDPRNRCRRRIRAPRTSRNAGRSSSGADRTLRRWGQRQARCVESADAVPSIVSLRSAAASGLPCGCTTPHR